MIALSCNLGSRDLLAAFRLTQTSASGGSLWSAAKMMILSIKICLLMCFLSHFQLFHRRFVRHTITVMAEFQRRPPPLCGRTTNNPVDSLKLDTNTPATVSHRLPPAPRSSKHTSHTARILISRIRSQVRSHAGRSRAGNVGLFTHLDDRTRITKRPNSINNRGELFLGLRIS